MDAVKLIVQFCRMAKSCWVNMNLA